MTLGERIRQCRIDAHLSHEKVAELIGVSRQAVTKWETNQSAPSTDNLFRLAELLGTTVDFLASPEPTEENTLAAQSHLLYKAEEEKRAKQQRANRKYNILTFAAVLCGYLAVFLDVGNIGICQSFQGWISSKQSGSHKIYPCICTLGS